MSVSPDDFEFYRRLLLEKSGHALTPEKTYLLMSRLNHVWTKAGYKDISSFTGYLRSSNDQNLVNAVVEAMTTNETSFFRDTKPFKMLADLLPVLMERRGATKTLRIWSAACSSGQEAYSLAIVMNEFLSGKPGWKCQIVGTDISHDIVRQAEKGEYNQFEIQRGLTIQAMLKHFRKDGQTWVVRDEIRNMVRFQHGNLLEPVGDIGIFDVVFCRNVLIYFGGETKEKVLGNIRGRMAPGGFLFLGACESVISLNIPFRGEPGMHGVYRAL